MNHCAALILAAGLGKRMHSDLPKVLHPLAGRPLLAHVLESLTPLAPDPWIVVVGHKAEQVQKAFAEESGIAWVQQPLPPMGTGHAVQCALPALEGFKGEVLILNGDVPLIRTETLSRLLQEHRSRGQAVTLLSTHLEEPTGYGRVVRSASGELERIVEEKDADAATRALQEINSGTWCIDAERLPALLAGLTTANAQQEYYLTDIVALARQSGLACGVLLEPDALSLAGVNSRAHLAEMEARHRDRLVRHWMEHGVTFVDPGSCWIGHGVRIGRDTLIQPNVILGADTVIGAHCRVGPFCQIHASRIGDNCTVEAFCHLDGAELEGKSTIGPYARLRPGTVLESGAKVGNFCEVKKSRIGQGSKVNHLSYIGDTEMGAGVNVGAGTITCNYDGTHKHRTVIEDGVFIGSDTQLVAPVKVGAGAVVGAGTTVTREVPPGALAVSRTPQQHYPDWKATRQRGKT